MNARILSVLMLFASAFALPVPAEEAADEIEQLKRQVQELDQKIRALERKQELETEVARKAAKETPRIVVGEKGLSVSSADTNFVFQLHGLLQTDNRTFFNDRLPGGKAIQGNDTFLLRRARPIFSGTIYRDFDFLFVPDFAGSSPQIFDAYLNFRYRPWLQLRGGKFKAPVGLEELQSDSVTSFNERALPTDLMPNRDIGFQLWGDVSDGVFGYAVGVFNGVADGRNTSNADFEDHREFAGRLFVQPFKPTKLGPLQGFGFGIGGSWGNVSSNATGLTSGYSTDGQQQFFSYTNGVVANGAHWRVSPQAYYYWGPFGMLGEYAISHQKIARDGASADLENTAWQISAGWVLTGEKASFTGVSPKRPFSPSAHQWGAVQLVARYAELDVDAAAFPLYANPATSASAAQAWTVGLNWYLNKNLRVNTSFSRTAFSGPINRTKASVTRQSEEVLFTRLQLTF